MFPAGAEETVVAEKSAKATDEANSADNVDAGGGCQGALQLLRREWKLQADSEVLEILEVWNLSYAEPP